MVIMLERCRVTKTRRRGLHFLGTLLSLDEHAVVDEEAAIK